MTAIVGLVHDGVVHVGGDSAGVGGWSMTVRADAKVFRNGPYVFGFTTSFRMGQLIRWSLEVPLPDGDLERFMCTVFIDAVRDCLKAGGYAAVGCGQELALGALFATEQTSLRPQERLEVALEAAERFSAGVRAPFAYMSSAEEN